MFFRFIRQEGKTRTDTVSTDHALDWHVNEWVLSNSVVKQDYIDAVMKFQVFGCYTNFDSCA